MNDLQRLIDDYIKDHPDESYATIAKRGGIPRQTVWALAKKEAARQTPRPQTISALARGMGISEEVVRRAAGQAAGYPSTPMMSELKTDRGRMIVESLNELDEERQEVLMRRLRFLLAEQREERGQGTDED